MSDEVMTAKCSRCLKRRRLRLAHVDPTTQAEFWLCCECRAEHDREQADAQPAESVDYTFGLEPGTLRSDDPDGALYELVCSAAWPAFIEFALKNDEIRKEFIAETGHVFDRQTAIEAMVDRMTGYRDDVMRRFVEWATVELYGIEGAPVAYRMEYAQRQKAAEVANG